MARLDGALFYMWQDQGNRGRVYLGRSLRKALMQVKEHGYKEIILCQGTNTGYRDVGKIYLQA